MHHLPFHIYKNFETSVFYLKHNVRVDFVEYFTIKSDKLVTLKMNYNVHLLFFVQLLRGTISCIRYFLKYTAIYDKLC